MTLTNCLNSMEHFFISNLPSSPLFLVKILVLVDTFKLAPEKGNCEDIVGFQEYEQLLCIWAPGNTL